MSSFKRKGSSKSTQTLPGTRPSPTSPSTTVTSVGIPSLDDILGGGLPLSCSLLTLAPDPHSSYGELVQKYVVAQGLAAGQCIFIVDDNAEDFVRDVMWMPTSGDEDKEEAEIDQNIKIAWRYADMKQFQTTVTYGDAFCQTFDLTSRIPGTVIDQALEACQLVYIPVNGGVDSVLHRIKDNLQLRAGAVRVCVRSLGSPEWGDVGSQDILRFMYLLRAELRRFGNACASLSMPSHLCTEQWGGDGWVQKLGWLSDACVTLVAFSGHPSLTAAFPSHHGMVEIHRMPAPHTLAWPSDRYSMLRGLSATAGMGEGSGENNLGFRWTRKRMVVETLHLDVEGGVTERRTDRPAETEGRGGGRKKVGFETEW